MSERDAVDEPIVIHPRSLDGDTDEAFSKPAAEPDGVVVAPQPPMEGQPESAQHSDFEGPRPAPAPTKRALSLDALRGFFMLIISLGFTIQEEIFPAWMYHRQNPPPTHDFVELAGLTWRDLAFPVFLFSMAAALPIVFMRRIERGAPAARIVSAILRRGVMLYAFALMIGHSNAYFIGEYTRTAWIVGLIGFAIMFGIFVRRKPNWNERAFSAFRAVAWAAAILFLALSPAFYGKQFDPNRSDLIISMIAFSSLVGAALWYVTRENLPVRVAALAAVLAISLGALEDGWIQRFWWASSVPNLIQPGWLTLLIVVIPGTIAGDFLARWMRAPEPADPTQAWSSDRLAVLALLGVSIFPILVVGTYNRWVMGTTQLLIGIAALALALTYAPTRPGERLVRQMWVWGALLLVFGMLMEPFQGGIKKVPGTLSYYFTMAGASMLLLSSFVITVDLLRQQKLVQWLIDVGQNPMIAYIVYSIFITAMLGLIPGSWEVLRGSPVQSLLRSFIAVALVVLIVRFLTRRRIFWRA